MTYRIEGPVPDWLLEKFPELKEAGVKPAKYHSRKVDIDGITFDSQKEADKYEELKLLKRAGEVVKIELQPAYVLQEGYRDQASGKWVRPLVYKADFRVWYRDGQIEVIDTKGYQTKVYRIKKKLFRRLYPDIMFTEC